MLSAAAFRKALASATGGETLVLARGQTVESLVINDRQWDWPVTVHAHGARIIGLMAEGVLGLHWHGGAFEAPMGKADADKPGGYGVHFLNCNDIHFGTAAVSNAYKAVFLRRCTGFSVSNLLVHDIRSDGVCMAGCGDGAVEHNWFRPFSPTPQTCTVPHTVGYRAGAVPVSVAAETLTGLSKAACEARGGKWKDGDHPDSIQIHSSGWEIIIRGNRSEGPQHGIGSFKPKAGEEVRDIRITDNIILTSGHNAIALNGAVGQNVVTDNIVGRWGGSPHKAQIRLEGTTGTFGNNVNPDAAKTHVALRRLP